jgi:hypothetical protein
MGKAVSQMTTEEKVREALSRSLPLMPADAAAVIKGMLSPEAIALIAGTLVIWAGSHFFGVGEIVDAILLLVGFVAIGFSILDVAEHLYKFADNAINAKSEQDLDRAAGHLARAVAIAGVTVVTAILLRRSPAKAKNVTNVKNAKPSLVKLPPPPTPGKVRIQRVSLGPGKMGSTSAYGDIKISTNISLEEQRLTLYHELIHSIFSPRVAPLRQLRARLSMSAYNRSAIMKYIEEALAETYAQLKVKGFSWENAQTGITFPVAEGYVTVSQLAVEGQAIGTIAVGSALFTVYVLNIPQEAPACMQPKPEEMVCR